MPGLLAVSLLTALLFARYGKIKDRRTIFLLVLLGQLSHVALDLLNSYGTQLFLPFSDARLSLDILFVVDLVFTGIVVAGLAGSRRASGRARAATAVLAAYVGVAALFHAGARDAVREAALREGMKVISVQALPVLPYVTLPVPGEIFSFAPSAVAAVFPAHAGDGPGALRRAWRIPVPAGPLAWDGFVDDGATYLRAEIEPLTGRVAWKQRVLHGSDVPEVTALRGMEDVETYLWFARFPAARVSHAGERTEVVLYDLRFAGMPDTRPFTLRVTGAPGMSPRARWGG